jgi:hypothetical protein
MPHKYALKLIQFHTNYRPPYYGTFKYKHQKSLPKLARSPFSIDSNIMYDHDSDEDWGDDADISDAESISVSDCDDIEDELSLTQSLNNSDTDENDWLVPDGGISDDGEFRDKKTCDDLKPKSSKKKKVHIEKKPVILGPFSQLNAQGKFLVFKKFNNFIIVPTLNCTIKLFSIGTSRTIDPFDGASVFEIDDQKKNKRLPFSDEMLPDLAIVSLLFYKSS